MPSSTSSSEMADPRPGGVQPRGPVQTGELPTHEVPQHDPPIRALPERPLGVAWLLAIAVFALGLLAWEWHWRDFGAVPGYRNSNGQWAQQRRRIDHGEGSKTVLLGASRVLSDVQLPAWERLTGERPIQLALEGTSPVPMLEDLAADPDFNGRVLVGVAPDVFFSGFQYRGEVLPYYRDETPAQRSGSWLSMQLLEPYLAFYDPDFALATVLERQAWPTRPDVPSRLKVRKLWLTGADRNTRLWSKTQTDPVYRALLRQTWAEDFGGPLPGMDTAEGKRKLIDEQVAKAAAAIAKLRKRGVEVLFVRLPSTGAYYAFEQKYLPRSETWDLLLQRTGTPGIHFEDHPQLQGYDLPEWSHMAASEADRFTEALVPIIQRRYWCEGMGRDHPVIGRCGAPGE